ncbi:MAG: hypothetical protein L6461_20250 [Anaerolineae bacterium]|nr:hypothetical protein [Anaerolineae bacterium]
MKKGMAAGCITWVILFSLMGACLVPVGLMTAGFTSQTDFVTQTMGGFLCPTGTTPELYTYATTVRSELGTDMPATASELICLDNNGQTVVNLGPAYAFIWTGVLGIAGLVVAAILSIFLAGPIGIFIAKKFGRKQESAIG